MPFKRLIYPVPVSGGLGIHCTLDLQGRAKVGPDVQWVDGLDNIYEVDEGRADDFYRAVRRYWPDLPDGMRFVCVPVFWLTPTSANTGALQPDYAGVRPKLVGPGEPAGDFVVQSSAVHGVSGLVNLYGIESPGLTAALSLARVVARAL